MLWLILVSIKTVIYVHDEVRILSHSGTKIELSNRAPGIENKL